MGTRLLSVIAGITAGAAVGATPAATPASSPELDNVVAFARLYGVVRYFYPADAAAGLDWDRFAVHGVARVRGARNHVALRSALEELFQPLGPGIEIGRSLPPPAPASDSAERLVAWRYLGPGFFSTDGGPYAGMRTHRAAPISGFVTLMQTRAAEALRGTTIRLAGKVRAAAKDASGGAALWLRVDRASRATGFFDNMSDRPVREAGWRDYAIEGTVAEDATDVAFGVMASGAVTADFDAVELSVRDAAGGWKPIPIDDPGFEATSAGGWMRAGTSRNAQVSRRPSEGAPEGRQFLRLSSPAGADAELFEGAEPHAGDHAEFYLSWGLRARVPLALPDSQAVVEQARKERLDALQRVLAAIPVSGPDPEADTRMADVVVAWNVYRHFHPYWAERQDVDWDIALSPALEAALGAQTRAAQADVLRALLAHARDGHAGVTDPARREGRAFLPIQLALVEDSVVITASGAPSEAPVGAVVSAMDGRPAQARLEDAMRLVSGTPQWRRVVALSKLTSGPQGTSVRLTVASGRGGRAVTLRYEAKGRPPERRPDPVAELEPGVWYVDLTRTKMEQLAPRLETLAEARGVVFDLRGYPLDAGGGILPHLIESPETDRWMHVAKLVGPFGQSAGWQSSGWNLAPARPRLRGAIVFLTDGRAISYAESVMGYVADQKLGTIVGRPTAGTNGNIATFMVPSGFRIVFTGMRVTAHDGRTVRHYVGIKPDVDMAPTLAGIREGRDELLERAVAVVKTKPRLGEDD